MLLVKDSRCVVTGEMSLYKWGRLVCVEGCRVGIIY